jgi:hypothetical protein
MTVEILYGLESHTKGLVDGYFAQLNFYKNQWALTRTIASVRQVVECYEASAKEATHKFEEHFVEWVPTASKAKVVTSVFKKGSLPCTLKASHSWVFQLLDRRRRSLVGRGGMRQVCTGIHCRASVLPHMPAGDLRTTQPELEVEKAAGAAAGPAVAAGAAAGPAVAAGAAAEAASDAEDEPPDASIILQQTNDHMGWRVSYRTQYPEDFANLGIIKRLRNKHAMLGRLGNELPTGLRVRAIAPPRVVCTAAASAVVPSSGAPSGEPDASALDVFFMRSR